MYYTRMSLDTSKHLNGEKEPPVRQKESSLTQESQLSPAVRQHKSSFPQELQLGSLVKVDLTVVPYESLPHSAIGPAMHLSIFRHVPVGSSTNSYPVTHTVTMCILSPCPTFYPIANACHYYIPTINTL